MQKRNGSWIVKASHLVYDDRWMEVFVDDVLVGNGGEDTFSYVKMRDGVSVVALTDADEVLLVSTHRYAAGEESVECVSGGLEPGEDALTGAKRELREELGAGSDLWTCMGAIRLFPSKLKQTETLFLARGVTVLDNASLDKGEVVSPVQVSFDTALEWVMSGKITHAASAVALLKAWRLLMREKPL